MAWQDAKRGCNTAARTINKAAAHLFSAKQQHCGEQFGITAFPSAEMPHPRMPPAKKSLNKLPRSLSESVDRERSFAAVENAESGAAGIIALFHRLHCTRVHERRVHAAGPCPCEPENPTLKYGKNQDVICACEWFTVC